MSSTWRSPWRDGEAIVRDDSVPELARLVLPRAGIKLPDVPSVRRALLPGTAAHVP